MQERRVRRPQQVAEHRVRLVAAAADRVVAPALVLHPAGLEVLQTGLEARLEDPDRGAPRERDARDYRPVHRSGAVWVGAVVEIEEGLEATGDLLFAADGHGFGKGRAS